MKQPFEPKMQLKNRMTHCAYVVLDLVRAKNSMSLFPDTNTSKLRNQEKKINRILMLDIMKLLKVQLCI